MPHILRKANNLKNRICLKILDNGVQFLRNWTINDKNYLGRLYSLVKN